MIPANTPAFRLPPRFKPGDVAEIMDAPGVPPQCVGRRVRIIDTSNWFVDAWETTRLSGWWRHPSEWLPQINGHHWYDLVLAQVLESGEPLHESLSDDAAAMNEAHRRWVRAFYGRTE